MFVKLSGGWANGNQTNKLTADDGEAQDNFGYSVAVDVDTVEVSGAGGVATLVVGRISTTPLTPTPLALDAGAAYVFTRNDGVWDDGEKLTASDGAAFD